MADHATSLNFAFGAPHTGHLSGASPTTVLPQTSQTWMAAAGKSFPAASVSNALRVQAVMDFFDGIGVAERNHRRLVPFGLGLLDEAGIHFLELMPLAVDGGLKVLLRVLHAAHDPQVGVGMNGFRSGSGTEQLGDLGMALGIGLGGEGEVLPVGLAFTGECGLKIVLGGHGILLSGLVAHDRHFIVQWGHSCMEGSMTT